MSFMGTPRTLSLGEHRHRLHPGQGPPCGPEALKAEHRPGQALHAAVVLLDQVVDPAAPAVPGEAPQLAPARHLPESARIALEPIGHDLPRVAGVLPAERLAEEALGRLLVALGAEQEVDRLARAVDGAVEVAPLAADPDEGLVDVPRPAAGAQVPPHPLLELGGEALDPAVQGDVVDEDAAVGEHQLEVAVADREPEAPAHRPQDHLGREAEATERPGVGHGRCSRRGGGGRSAAPTRSRGAAQRDGTRSLGTARTTHRGCCGQKECRGLAASAVPRRRPPRGRDGAEGPAGRPTQRNRRARRALEAAGAQLGEERRMRGGRCRDLPQAGCHRKAGSAELLARGPSRAGRRTP